MTFSELGIPFPLFEAPVENAAGYAGQETCGFCRAKDRPCFELGIGDDVMVVCPHCQTENGLDADDKASGACINCGKTLSFPADSANEDPLYICYACLRTGGAAITKDTVFGMIRWQEAQKGQTHGIPGNAPRLPQTDVEWVEAEGGWKAARLASDMMWELLRTPNYTTWQGEQWQFDGQEPMLYVGEWNQNAFNNHAPGGNGKAFFDEIVTDGLDDQWDYLNEAMPCVYVFRSTTQEKYAAHWDAD